MKKIIIPVLAVTAALTLFTYNIATRTQAVEDARPAAARKPAVRTASMESLAELRQANSYSATVAGTDEARVVAKTSGTITQAPAQVGESVKQGMLLVRIDETGGNSVQTADGFRSGQVRQARLALEQARQAYDAAKDAYKSLKDDDAGDSQLDAAKSARELAELQLDSAQVSLESVYDSHLITSPLSGRVISKSVSVGDSVTQGQLLYVVGRSSDLRAKFYVEQDILSYLSKGTSVNIENGQGRKIDTKIQNISPTAEPQTRRFLIETFPFGSSDDFFSGSVVEASFSSVKKIRETGNVFVPLSELTVSQNDSHIFIIENGTARKRSAKIIEVSGEYAEIYVDTDSSSRIVIDGSKLLRDGDSVTQLD